MCPVQSSSPASVAALCARECQPGAVSGIPSCLGLLLLGPSAERLEAPHLDSPTPGTANSISPRPILTCACAPSGSRQVAKTHLGGFDFPRNCLASPRPIPRLAPVTRTLRTLKPAMVPCLPLPQPALPRLSESWVSCTHFPCIWGYQMLDSTPGTLGYSPGLACAE